MNKTRLFIENQEIELDKSTQIAITKQFEDLSNPTTIINDWSKTISIPFTEHNNKVFGHLYDPKRTVISKTGTNLLQAPINVKSNTDKSLVWNDTDKTLIYDDLIYSIQVGFIYWHEWSYSVKEFYNNEGSFDYEFILDKQLKYRFEISFRDFAGNEYAFAQFRIGDYLDEGQKYKIHFNIERDAKTKQTIISDVRLTKKEDTYGIFYDPTKMLDFRLEYNNDVLMAGYVKTNSITRKNGTGYYNISLSGNLGKIFFDLLRLSFDVTKFDTIEEKQKYYIDGTRYFNDVIDRNLVYKSWNEDADLSKPLEQASTTDIIGFGKKSDYITEGFNAKTMQNGASDTIQIADLLKDVEPFKSSNIDADGFVGDGLYSTQMLQYRSYEQPPFIYLPRLFDILKDKAYALGYTINLDNRWFNERNPYYNPLIVSLKPMTYNTTVDTTPGSVDYLTNELSKINWIPANITNYRDVKYVDVDFERSDATEWSRIEDGVIYISDDRYQYNIKLNFNVKTTVYAPFARFQFRQWQIITLTVIGGNGNRQAFNYLIGEPNDLAGLTTEEKNELKNKYNIALFPQLSEKVEQPRTEYIFTLPLNVNIDTRTFGNFVSLQLSSRYTTENYPFVIAGVYTPPQIDLEITNKDSIQFSYSLDKHSGNLFTLNDLWDNEYSLFDIILNYTKLFDIKIINNAANELTFIARNDYFTDGQIIDWSDKIDYSKDFNLKYTKTDYKYLHFNYKDSDSFVGKDYKAKTGVNYGELKLNTNNNSTEKESKVFANPIYAGTVVSETKPQLEEILNGNLSIAGKNALLTANCQYDNEGKFTSDFGALFFYTKLEYLNRGELDGVYLTDDTTLQRFNDFYTYIDFTELPEFCRQTFVVPSFEQSVKLGVGTEEPFLLLNTINKPTYVYAQIAKFNSSKTISIYDYIWKYYLSEVYNIQNKLVTCYVKLSPSEYNKFSFNNFVMIENQLYLVNKIFDYSPDNVLTKVELLSIQDPRKYTYTPILDKLELSETDITLPSGSSSVIKVSSLSDWKYEIVDGDKSLVSISSGLDYIEITNTSQRIATIKLRVSNNLMYLDVDIHIVPIVKFNVSPLNITLQTGTQYMFTVNSNAGYKFTEDEEGDQPVTIVFSPATRYAVNIEEEPRTTKVTFYATLPGEYTYYAMPNTAADLRSETKILTINVVEEIIDVLDGNSPVTEVSSSPKDLTVQLLGISADVLTDPPTLTIDDVPDKWSIIPGEWHINSNNNWEINVHCERNGSYISSGSQTTFALTYNGKTTSKVITFVG